MTRLVSMSRFEPNRLSCFVRLQKGLSDQTLSDLILPGAYPDLVEGGPNSSQSDFAHVEEWSHVIKMNLNGVWLPP